MYVPNVFEEKRSDVLAELIAKYPLGTLVSIDGDGALQANNVPFLFEDGALRGHVARGNPLWRETRGESLVIFQGPNVYVSPSFYPSKAVDGKVVPTWNYATVQARGMLRAIDDKDWLRDLVTRLTDRHEGTREKPWAVTDAPADYIDKMLPAIVGIEIHLTSLVGKWKTSQNRTPVDRAGVLDALTAAGNLDATTLTNNR